MRTTSFVWIGLLDFVAVMLGLALSVAAGRVYPAIGNPLLYYSAATVAVALITFFGLLALQRRDNEKLNEGDMRTALAASVLLAYIVIVGLVAFFSPIREGTPVSLSPLTEMMLTSFTTVVAIIVPFYFGASAYAQTRAPQQPSDASATSQNPPAQMGAPARAA